MQTYFLALLVFIPITIAGSLLGFTPTWLLFCPHCGASGLVAKFIGDATEELSAKSGPALAGC
jgi:Ca2+/H+ antiporter